MIATTVPATQECTTAPAARRTDAKLGLRVAVVATESFTGQVRVERLARRREEPAQPSTQRDRT